MSNNSLESNDSASPAASDTEARPPAKQGFVVPFNEVEAKNSIVEARGDLFIAAQILRTTALRLKRAIDVSPVLQATVEELEQTDKRKSVTDAQIHRAIEARLALYRVSGLDALHDLATMPIDSNSAQNQVKLAAAARLAGSPEAGGTMGDMAETFKELRELYESHAPRLRVVRERTTVEVVGHDPVVASQLPPASTEAPEQ